MTSFRRRCSLIFILAAAVSVMTAARAAGSDLDLALEQILRDADLGQTQVAVCVMDMKTGKVLASMDADAQMMPASNAKLFTTACALDVLGPDFVFRTQLGMVESQISNLNSEISDLKSEILNLKSPSSDSPHQDMSAKADTPTLPSLIVHGDGDPAFGDPVLLERYGMTAEQLLQSWVRAVVATGERHFARLIIDDRIFDQQFIHPDWEKSDLTEHYGAQVAGLNFYENCIDVIPQPTQPGQSASVRLYPAAPFLETVNRAVTGKQDAFILDRKLGTNMLVFAGSVHNARTYPFKITVNDPPMFFGHLLANRLEQAGVRVDEVVRPAADATLPHAQPLHRVQTTLPLVLGRTNQDSQNMFAEALFKRIGHELTGQPGSWANGAAAVRAALNRRLGAAAASITIVDGSGLSRSNRVTAHLIVELLYSMYQDPIKGPIYRKSLSHAGVNGTLQNRMKDLDHHAVVFGKSGYIHSVSALSGYLMVPIPAPSLEDSLRSGVSSSPHAASEERGTSDEGAGKRVIGFSFIFNGFKPPIYNHKLKDLQNHMVACIDDAVAQEVAPVGGTQGAAVGLGG